MSAWVACCRCQTACEGCASQDAAAEAVVQHRLGRGPLLLLGVCLCGPPLSPPWGAGGHSVSAWVACCRCQTACEGCASQDAAAEAVVQHRLGRGPLLLLGVCLCGPPLSPPWGAGGRSVSAWVACCRCQTACEGCASQDAAAVAVVQHRPGRGSLLLFGVCLCGPPRSSPWGAGGRSVSAWVACCRCQTACEGCASQDAAAVAVVQHPPGRGSLLLFGVCLCGPPRSSPWGAGGRSVSAWVACCRCQTACEGCASQDAAAVAVLELVAGRCFGVCRCHAHCWCACRVGGAVPCGWLVSVSRGWRCAMRIAGVRDCCRCQTACEGCASQDAAAEGVVQHRLGRGPLLLLGVCLCGPPRSVLMGHGRTQRVRLGRVLPLPDSV